MNHLAWASKQLIVPIALALAFAPAGEPAESSLGLHLDRRANGVERIALLPGSSEQNSSEPQETIAQPAPQLSPAAAAQTTIKPPQVTYGDGQLTIIAENSSLSEVMKALRVALGADIDLPAGVADQHIWVHLGPGPARRVLRDLLDGTEFNYMIQASQDEDGIRSVMLTLRSKSAAPLGNPAIPESAVSRRIPPSASRNETPEPENVANAQSVVPATAAPAADPSLASANQPESSVNPQRDTTNSNTPTSTAAALAAGQMMQQLQSMYQQRRQMQMLQNQRASAPAPNQ